MKWFDSKILIKANEGREPLKNEDQLTIFPKCTRQSCINKNFSETPTHLEYHKNNDNWNDKKL